MTAKLTLVQEIDKTKQPGFLIYLPVYRDRSMPETEEERAEQLIGYVYSPFRASDFFNGLMGPGARFDVDAEDGSTVMENAIRNAVPGIEAECGGACACATCHVYVDDEWMAEVGEPSSMEEDMLD